VLGGTMTSDANTIHNEDDNQRHHVPYLLSKGSHGNVYTWGSKCIIKVFLHSKDKVAEYEFYNNVCNLINGKFYGKNNLAVPVVFSDDLFLQETNMLETEGLNILTSCIPKLRTENFVDYMIMMCRVDGITIDTYLSRAEWLVQPTGDRFLIPLDIINTVEHLHSTGYAHGDLSFNNIMKQHRPNNTPHIILIDMVSCMKVQRKSKRCPVEIPNFHVVQFPMTTWSVVAPEIIVCGSIALKNNVFNMQPGTMNESLYPLNDGDNTSGCGFENYVSIYINPFSADKFSVGVITLCCFLGIERSQICSDKAVRTSLLKVLKGNNGSGCNTAAVAALELYALFFLIDGVVPLVQTKQNDASFLSLYCLQLQQTTCWPPTEKDAVEALLHIKSSKTIALYREKLKKWSGNRLLILSALLHPLHEYRMWPSQSLRSAVACEAVKPFHVY